MTITTLRKIGDETEIANAVLRDFPTLQSVIEALVELVGVVVVGAVGDVTTARSVRYWMQGDKLPTSREPQLRFSLRLALMINQRCGHGATQAWFKGSNPYLDDRAPAMLLREDFSEATQRHLLRAARELTA